MTLNVLILCVGLALLLAGGDLLVRGASALAKGFGVSPLVIGLTVVAFGTSAPELSVNLLAAYQGQTEISFGNIIGSNIANIGLILGLSAMIRPLAIEGVIITREIPMMGLASLVALTAGADSVLRGSPNLFDRAEGLIFLLLFCVFLFYTIGDVFRKRTDDPLLQQAKDSSQRKSFKPTLYNALLFVLGLILLVFGGKIAVNAALAVAELLKVPRVIIGLTIIAVGTSLPELATSVMATWKGQTDIAIGNIVGSNIFNLLFINGLTATLRPVPVPSKGGLQDLFMMTFLALLLLPMCLTDNKKIVRWEGGLLLLFYVAFNTWRFYAG